VIVPCTKELIKEANLLRNLNHKRIIGLVESFPEVNTIILEYGERGNVKDFLKKEKIDWNMRLKWMMQILEFLEFIHRKGVVHRHLEIENLELTNDLDIKVSQFGKSLWTEDASQKVNSCLPFQFDFRQFGTVLGKLLLHGDDVINNKKVIDSKSLSIPCEISSYHRLVNLCFHPFTKYEILNAVASSIMLHFPNGKASLGDDLQLDEEAKNFVNLHLKIMEGRDFNKAKESAKQLSTLEPDRLILGFLAYPHKKTEEQEEEERITRDLELLKIAKENKDVSNVISLLGSQDEIIRLEAGLILSQLSGTM